MDDGLLGEVESLGMKRIGGEPNSVMESLQAEPRVKVMAPAGDWASLAAALQAGADAVYFGVGPLNMRAGGNVNFTEQELGSVVEKCHAGGALAYLTVNTVVYEEEIAQLTDLLRSARGTGVDAVIVSDQAAIEIAAELGVPVHISTQLSISNSRAVRFYSRWAEVMVLARELSLEQVASIHQTIQREGICGPSGRPVELELFCHGAFCMAISGKCYLSLHDCARSANRGECIQICRRGYRLTDRETGNEIDVDNEYLMSPKDLCTIGILDRIIGSGVRVLKIEGRARSPEYVKVTTQCYREAVRALEQGRYEPRAVERWEGRLRTVFNRGFWEGYYLGRRMGEWSGQYGSQATERKYIVGRIKNFYRKARVADIAVEGPGIHRGDRLYVIGETTGVLETQVQEVRVDDAPVEHAVPGSRCCVRLDGLARRGDRIFVRVRQEGASQG